MAFDATIGGASANSYGTDTDADTYFTDRGVETWTGAAADKQEALINATDYLERTYAGQWIGIKATDAQRLSWPRAWVTDADGYAVETNELPRQLTEATYELALLSLTGEDLKPTLTRAGAVTRERVKAGPVESETEYSSGASARPTYTAVHDLIQCLIHGNGSTVELLRA